MLLLGGLVVGALPSITTLYIAGVLTGTGYMLAYVALNNGIGKVTEARRLTDAFPAMAVCFSLSGLTGPMVSGFLIEHAGHQFAFLALALFPAVALLLLTRAARAYPVMRVADAMTVRASGGEMSVRPGDTARYSVEQKHAIENRGKTTASARSESAPKCGRDFAQGLRLKTPSIIRVA